MAHAQERYPDLPIHTNLLVSEVARFLGVSKRTVYELVDEGALPSIRWERMSRIPRAQFLVWYEQML